MDQKLATILAVDYDSEQAFERHDRCAAWASAKGWRLRKRMIFEGDDAKDEGLIRQRIEQLAESMAADVLITESLSQISSEPTSLVEIIELLGAKGIQLIALKECLDGANRKTCLTALLGAITPLDPNLSVVFAGPKESRPAATRLAGVLGWDLLFPRARRVEQQLQSAPDRALLLPSLKVLGPSMAARAKTLTRLLDSGRQVLVIDAGLDSSAPGAPACMLAHIAVLHEQPTEFSRVLNETAEGRPKPLELLKQWVGRRRKTISGSAVKYIAQSGYSSSAFYRVVHGVTMELIKELNELAASNGRDDYTDEEVQIVAARYDLKVEELRFVVDWSKKAALRSHSTSTSTSQS